MNAGKKPLIIHQVLGGCCSDCVTAVWPKQPIQPSEQGEIKVNNTDQEGEQTYVIVVSANTEPPETRLLCSYPSSKDNLLKYHMHGRIFIKNRVAKSARKH